MRSDGSRVKNAVLAFAFALVLHFAFRSLLLPLLRYAPPEEAKIVGRPECIG